MSIRDHAPLPRFPDDTPTAGPLLAVVLCLLVSCRGEQRPRPQPRVDCAEVAAELRSPSTQRMVVESLGNGGYAACHQVLFLEPEVTIVDPGDGLCFAAFRGDGELVAYLIGHGVGVDARTDRTSFTPLMCAAMDNRPDVVKLLLNHGADVTAQWVDEGKDGSVHVYSVKEIARKYGADEATLSLLPAPPPP